MTEAEWETCIDPQRMLAFLKGKVSERKLRLFACGLWRHARLLHLTVEEMRLVEAAERLAEGQGGEERFLARGRDGLGLGAATGQAAAEEAVRVYEGRWRPWGAGWVVFWERLRAPICQLLRDVIGSPFRPVAVDPAWLAWHSGVIPLLARRMYDFRDCSDMPILGDMLEEAGCFDEQMLRHCRGKGLHARGCFLLDALLGKE
jgi:hypothetical protein